MQWTHAVWFRSTFTTFCVTLCGISYSVRFLNDVFYLFIARVSITDQRNYLFHINLMGSTILLIVNNDGISHF